MNTGKPQSELAALRQRVAGLEQQNAQLASTEATLRDELHRFNDLLEISADWIWEIDATTRFTSVSAKCRDLLGYEPADLVGKTPADISPPDERQRMATIIVPLIEAHQPFRAVETVNLRQDGQPVLVEISGIPLFDEHGTWCGYRGITIDITERRQMEATLRQREASLNEAQRFAHLGNWEWNVSTGVLTWSDEVFRIFGHQPQSFTPTFDAFVQTIHPDDRARVQDDIQRSVTNNVRYATRYRIVQPDGTECHVFAEGTQSYDAEGNPLRMFGIIQDVTERAQAEEAVRQLNVELEQRVEERTRELLQNQQMLQTVMDALPMAIFWKDRESVYRGSNQAFATLAGLASPADFVGKTDYDMPWKPEETEFFRTVDDRVMGSDTPELNIEEPILTAQGEQRWIRTNKLPLHDPDGTVVGIIGAFEDITERKQQEETLRVFETMVKHAPDAMGYARPDSIIVSANAAYRALTGYADPIGMSFGDHFSEAHREAAIQAFTHVLNEEAIRTTLVFQRPDGSLLNVDSSGVMVHDANGQPQGVIGIFRDLTEQQQAEAERAALQQQVIAAQRAALRELSAPLLPISAGVVIMPLIGAIDTNRAQQVMETLLDGVATHRAATAIIDITGVQVVDTQVANALMQVAQAVRLLGAQVVLTGIGPAMAQTLVSLGVDLGGIITRGNLQGGIAYALRTSRGNGLKNGG